MQAADAMGKKDTVFMLLVLGGAGYGIHANWDAVKVKLGLDDLSPGRIKAIELTKKARGFEQYRSNWEVLRDWQSGEQIQVVGDPWQAEPVDDQHWRVYCTYKEAGQMRRHQFDTNVASGVVEYVGEVGAR